MNSRIPRTPSQQLWRDEFKRMVRNTLVMVGESGLIKVEDKARAMASMGVTELERSEGEQMLSIIQECRDERQKIRG